MKGKILSRENILYTHKSPQDIQSIVALTVFDIKNILAPDFSQDNDNIAKVKAAHTKLSEEEIQQKIQSYDDYYTTLGLTADLQKNLTEDLEYKKNRQKFIENIQKRFSEDQSSQHDILQALRIATQAHEGQVSMRPGDTEGASFVPYINHPIQVANLTNKVGLSPSAIQAALLHDVLEDTVYTYEELNKLFSEQTMRYVDVLTQRPGESKEEYFDRIDKSEDIIRILKGLDRYHNLIRSFPINDMLYIQRYGKETNECFSKYFDRYPQLAPYKENFDQYISAMKRRRVIDRKKI